MLFTNTVFNSAALDLRSGGKIFSSWLSIYAKNLYESVVQGYTKLIPAMRFLFKVTCYFRLDQNLDSLPHFLPFI